MLRLLRVVTFLALAWSTAVAADYRKSYEQALDAYAEQRWSDAIGHLDAALSEEPRDATRVKLHGMRFEPYLPHAFRALALYHMGNCAGAMRDLDAPGVQDIIRELPASGLRSEVEQMTAACRSSLAAAQSPMPEPGVVASAPAPRPSASPPGPAELPVPATAPSPTPTASPGSNPATGEVFRSRYSFQPPASPRVDTAAQAALHIDLRDDLKELLARPQPPGSFVGEAALAERVVATLVALDETSLSVQALTSAEQRLLSEGKNTWRWRVTPRAPGPAALLLTIEAVTPGGRSATVSETIELDVAPTGLPVWSGWYALVLAVAVGLAIAAITFAIARRRGRPARAGHPVVAALPDTTAADRSTTGSVFVSYSRADTERLEPILRQIERMGLRLWVDVKGIDGAALWRSEIVAAINGAPAILVFLSKNSLASRNVERELSIASEANKPIVPVMLEAVEASDGFSYLLAGVQWISAEGAAVDDTATRVQRALARLQ